MTEQPNDDPNDGRQTMDDLVRLARMRVPDQSQRMATRLWGKATDDEAADDGRDGAA